MTNVITLTSETKAPLTRADLLDDHMTRVAHAFGIVSNAVDDLVRAIDALDDDDAPEGVRNLASGMHGDAEQIQSQCADLFGFFCALEILAEAGAESASD